MEAGRTFGDRVDESADLRARLGDVSEDLGLLVRLGPLIVRCVWGGDGVFE